MGAVESIVNELNKTIMTEDWIKYTPKLTKLVDEASFEVLLKVIIEYLKGNAKATWEYGVPFLEETLLIRDTLIELNRYKFLTIDSQPFELINDICALEYVEGYLVMNPISFQILLELFQHEELAVEYTLPQSPSISNGPIPITISEEKKMGNGI